MKVRMALLVCLAVSVVVVVAGCGGGFPTGTFERAVDSSFEMELREDGTVLFRGSIQGDTNPMDSGTYSVEGSELVFETSEYCDATDRGAATYTWSFKGGVLTLDPVGVDPCVERWQIVDTEWYLQSE